MTETRELNVVSAKEERTGLKDGREWTLWLLAVQDAEGNPINETFKAFGDTPFTPGLRKYVVKPYPPDGEVESYTLSLPGAGGSALVTRVSNLETRVGNLEAQTIAGAREAEQFAVGASSGGKGKIIPGGSSDPAPKTTDDDIPF